MSAYAAYDTSHTSARATPVKLAEMVDAVDAVAAEQAASQRALVGAGLRVEPDPSRVRRIVALEMALEVLHAIEGEPGLAKRVSQLVAERRKEFA